MDQVQQVVEPCRQFMKDSMRLVKRCTKPDRKGDLEVNVRNVITSNGSFRVSKDRHGDGDWLRHYGLHRLLRQTYSHSHQQHHCVSYTNAKRFLIQNTFISAAPETSTLGYLLCGQRRTIHSAFHAFLERFLSSSRCDVCMREDQ